MASIVIAGDTSGAVTIAAPATAGTPTLTLPTTSGTLVVTGGAQTIEFAAGSAAAPSITFTGDTNTGIFSPAADTIAFTEGGVESMRIDSSGNVRIGATGALTTNERLTVATTTTDTYSAFQQSSGITAVFGVDATGAYSGSYTNQAYVFRTNNTERMRITSDGKVGIGVTPSSVDGIFNVNINGTAFHLGYGTNFDNYFTAGSSGIQVFRNAGTERMRIDSSGNVGIGTNNPSGFNARTAIRDDSKACLNLSSTGNGARVVFENIGTDAYGLGMPSGTGALAFFSSNVTERMRITSGGDVLVGTTTSDPIGNNVTGIVQGANGVSSFMASSDVAVKIGRKTTTGGLVDFFYYSSSLNYTGGISTAGTTTAYNTSSDYRLKENIAPMQGALAKVQALKPVTYTWKADGSDGQGFIAHELQAVVPDCVTGEKDAVDAEGKPVYQGVDTSFLVATLTAAIQELNAKVEAQAAEIAALKGAN